MYYKSYRTWIFFGYLMLILIVSSQANYKYNFIANLWKYDKIIHFIEYIGVGFLLINAMKIKPITKSQWKYAIFFLFIFPLLDESLQNFIPTRIPDIFDVFADITGGLVGAYLRRYI